MAAKQAGYSVTVIDAFADQQTIASSNFFISVPFDEHGFEAAALKQAINRLDTNDYVGFVYGSGFEAQPELLQTISEQIPLIGNAAEVLSAVKSTGFFEALDSLNIPYPQTFRNWPDKVFRTYLKKSFGGCGGTHISIASPKDQLHDYEYFQQFIKGQSVSLLFLAYENEVDVIGFNEQWVSVSGDKPFRYGGAVSNVDLPQAIQQQLLKAAHALTTKFNLKGLNSLDAVVENNIVYILEINPRLSATFDLYDADLFKRHLCANNPALKKTQNSALGKPAEAKAHAIVYAEEDTVFLCSFEWPEWATDIPSSHTESITIKSGEPICTVLASAKDAETAKLLVMSRVKILNSAFDKNDK
ncbi:MAG TPA: ATP-grasp domain-containing protein [Methylotenera sp.]|nr:ATP-grasp domain-containing protein [Methylotenera sp.]